MARVEQVVKAAKEEKTAKLAEEARAADAKQIVAKNQSDFQVLRSCISDELTRAQNTAKDLKYIRDRQAHFGSL